MDYQETSTSFTPHHKGWISGEVANTLNELQSTTFMRQIRQFTITVVIVFVITLIFATVYHFTDPESVKNIMGYGGNGYLDAIFFSVAADLGMVGDSVFLTHGVKYSTKVLSIMQLAIVMSVLIFTLNVT